MKGKVIKFEKMSGCTDMHTVNIKWTHLTCANGSYATLCGIGEEEFEPSIGTEITAKLTCPDCIAIVGIVKTFIKSNPT